MASRVRDCVLVLLLSTRVQAISAITCTIVAVAQRAARTKSVLACIAVSSEACVELCAPPHSSNESKVLYVGPTNSTFNQSLGTSLGSYHLKSMFQLFFLDPIAATSRLWAKRRVLDRHQASYNGIHGQRAALFDAKNENRLFGQPSSPRNSVFPFLQIPSSISRPKKSVRSPHALQSSCAKRSHSPHIGNFPPHPAPALQIRFHIKHQPTTKPTSNSNKRLQRGRSLSQSCDRLSDRLSDSLSQTNNSSVP